MNGEIIHHIPLIWFLLVFLYIYKRRGFDVSAYISLLYVITSAASSFIVIENIRNISNTSIFTTFSYCGLITLSIIPIYKFNFNSISEVKISNIKIFDYITYFFFLITMLTIILYWKDIIMIVSMDDWAYLRNEIYRGNALTTVRYGGILHHVFSVINIFGKASYLMFPIFFIYLCFVKKPIWFCVMALIATTNVIFDGILTVDRSTTFIWFIMFGLCFVMFKSYIEKKTLKKIVPIIAIPISIGVVYFLSVTISRFEESSSGLNNSVIEYTGQPYLNFCDFFENFDNREGITTKQLFPYTHQYIIKDYEGIVGNQRVMSEVSHMECGVFYTFLGAFILDSNQIGPFLFIILYLAVFKIFSSKNFVTHIKIERILVFFILSIIPAYGCIAYYFASGYITLSTITVLLLINFTKTANYKKYYRKD